MAKRNPEPISTEVEEFVSRAKIAGGAAFTAGKPAAPCLDLEFGKLIREVNAIPLPRAIVPMLYGWTEAWHAQNLAACAVAAD